MKFKRNIFLLIYNLLFVISPIQAQNIDSLKSILNNTKIDTSRVQLSIELANHLYLTNPIQAINLCEQAKNISIKANYKKGIAESYGWLGYLHLIVGNSIKALEYNYKSLQLAEEFGNKQGIATLLGNIGSIYEKHGDITKALEYYHKGLKIQEENLTANGQIVDKKGLAISIHNIGSIYEDQGDTNKALEFYKRSLKIREEINDKWGVAISLNNIGNIIKVQGNLEESMIYYQKVLIIQSEIDDKGGIAATLNNMGAIYLLQENYSMTFECFMKSLKIRRELADREGITKTLNNIGNYFLKKNCLTEALYYSHQSLKMAKELGYPENIKRAANTLKEIYKKQNKFAAAFDMYELEILMRDSINNEATKKASIQKQFQYQYEKKAAADSVANAKQHEIKNIEIKKQQAEIKAKRNQQFALYGGLTMVIVFAGFMYNRFRVTNKQKQIIEIKEKETQQQKQIIEEKHKEITDSINYAERIQRSFLASKELLDENLNDYFVMFQPKDVVSGDFYWATKLSNGNFVLATADSTGHGVPGSIMSLLNITSLESAIKDGHTQAAEILNATRKTIIERLKKDGSVEGGKDGMDCSLTIYDFTNKKLFVSAANNPVWIVRGIEVIEIQPDKMPVGKHDKQDVLFTQHEIDLQKGDVVYTLTDGFPDQFGGENGKKFMSKKLRELLLANANLPMQEQKELLLNTFKNWVGDLEQVDDVCVIGVRV